MTQEFIPYEQALALKELGFNEYCLTSYLNGNLQTEPSEIFWFQHSYRSHKKQEFISAPTFSQAFRWFRNNYGCNGVVEGDRKNGFEFCIYTDTDYYIKPSNNYDTYEEAELELLNQLIEIVKTNKT